MNEEEKEVESLEDSILKLMDENRELRKDIDNMREEMDQLKKAQRLRRLKFKSS